MAGSEASSERALAPCPRSPNCVSSEATDAAHRIEGFVLREPADASWTALARTVEAMPRTRIAERDARYLHAEATSRWFRFVDDLELLRAADGRGVAVRSASRVGYSDLGANRNRVEALREALRRAGAIE